MIAQLIYQEGLSLLSSLFFGMVLAWVYDCIRVFRRVCIHRRVWTMSVEDMIYWLAVALTVFGVIYEMNNGIVRGFCIVGFLIGALLYRYSFGRYYVKYISKLILFLLKPLKKVVKFVKMKMLKGAKFFLGIIKKGRDLTGKKEKSNEV